MLACPSLGPKGFFVAFDFLLRLFRPVVLGPFLLPIYHDHLHFIFVLFFTYS